MEQIFWRDIEDLAGHWNGLGVDVKRPANGKPNLCLLSGNNCRMQLVLGEHWSNAVLPLQLILLTIPLRIISNLFTPLMKALGFPSTGLIHISFSLLLTVIAIYFASGYGIIAVAASWLITTPLFFLFAVYLCASRAGISSMAIIQAVLPPLLLSSVMLGLLYCLQQLLLAEIDMLPRLVIMIVTGAVFYVLALRLCFKARFNEALKFRL